MGDSIFTPTEVTSDLNRLEQNLKRLGVEYEMYLTRMTKWAPFKTKAEVEAIIQYYATHVPRRTVDRFRFNTLVHRYRTSQERWTRRERIMNMEGTAAGPPGKRERLDDPSRPHVLASTKISGGQPQGDQLRDLYLTYKQARVSRGLPVSNLNYSALADRIGQTIEQFRQKYPGKDLELRVDEVGGKVRIAVKPTGQADQTPAPATTGS